MAEPDAPSDWRPKAIVFDLLTGLLNSWAAWDASTPSRAPGSGRRWRERYLELTFGAGAYAPETSYERLVRRAARDEGLPASAPDALLTRWRGGGGGGGGGGGFWSPGLEAWPGAGGVLRELAARGYALGVVTNCSAELGGAAVAVAEACVPGTAGTGGAGGGFSFDAVVTAEESGFYKPARAAYEAILVKMGLGAEDVLFVAGSAGDVQGATDAGMKVVWHNHVGLDKKGGAVPLREGRSLDDALRDFL